MRKIRAKIWKRVADFAEFKEDSETQLARTHTLLNSEEYLRHRYKAARWHYIHAVAKRKSYYA